jgi:glycosyltransferase involved in cell wall biosynthesis
MLAAREGSSSVSVCLCTYNGERFLAAQLDSLAVQTRQPDELVVRDDGSSDGTVALVQSFADRAAFPVKILRSDERSGPAGNLEVVLQEASGDVLFPCDQDDIWMPSKIERLLQALELHPEIPAAFSDSALIDAEGMRLPGSLWSIHGFPAAAQARVEAGKGIVDIALRNVVASHALALRRSGLSLVLPFDGVRYADWWVLLLLAGSDLLVPVDDCLVDYRQHSATAVGAFTTASVSRRLTEAPIGRLAARAVVIRAVVARLNERRPDALSEDDMRWLLAYAPRDPRRSSSAAFASRRSSAAEARRAKISALRARLEEGAARRRATFRRGLMTADPA